jgi:hexosaminidase
VAWAGGPVAWDQDGAAGLEPGGHSPRPPLRGRVARHLRRLDAAGVEYRPLAGPRPWQQGGAGPRRHRPGYRIDDVSAHLDQIAALPGQL